MMENAKSTIEEYSGNIKKRVKKQGFVGKGGFGKVFTGKLTKPKKRRVAVKILPHVSERAKTSNYYEIANLIYSQHENVVEYICSYQVKNELWLITEYLEGGTLSIACRSHKFSDQHIAFIARSILRGLEFMHNKGIVHRDLKSSNVMLSLQGTVKIIDFGLCAFFGEEEKMQVLGSPYWMSPEMVLRRPHGKPTDIWSFAVCMMEMFLKEPPNRSSSMKALLYAATDRIKECFLPSMSDICIDFLSLCFNLDPYERPTATELLEHEFLQVEDIDEGLQDVLRSIFVANTFAMSGM
eukprot:TRINITY_DN2704_c1_g1_i2.p1 TRINITY_DN2704_c1_g1~~TRINITY_DN2704_c1_g1_i2.p1  ORF type:complete len:296 (-),score=50.83 TRINITY_DN2704_c1_g1_i2:28-915(-)